MRKQFIALAVGMLLVTIPAKGQSQDAWSRWGDATLDKLEPFLPDASKWGFVPELPGRPSDFKAFANQGSHKYLELLVHKNWYFADPGLFKNLDEVRRQKAALRQQSEAALDEYGKTHRLELDEQQKAYAEQSETLTKQAQALIQKGKFEEGKALIAKIKPFQDSAGLALAESFSKREQELSDREKELMALRRSVSFRIYANRTAFTTQISRLSNAPEYQLRPDGTLAGHPLFRQAQLTGLDAQLEQPEIKLAVYLGPANFQNPLIKLRESDLKVKCIVVWAWIESRPDVIGADEAMVKNVLAAIDYNGLARLIEP